MCLRHKSTVSHLYYILMPQFPQIFDLTDCRHVQPVLELPDLDLLYSNLAASRNFPSCDFLDMQVNSTQSSLTPIDNSIGSFTNFLVLRPGEAQTCSLR